MPDSPGGAARVPPFPETFLGDILKLTKGDLTVETSLPREQVQRQAEGFVPVRENDSGGALAGGLQQIVNGTGKAETVAPAPKPCK